MKMDVITIPNRLVVIAHSLFRSVTKRLQSVVCATLPYTEPVSGSLGLV